MEPNHPMFPNRVNPAAAAPIIPAAQPREAEYVVILHGENFVP